MDCSKTIDFFSELKRLCSLRRTCGAVAHDEQCPLQGFCEIAYSKIYIEDATMAVENLQKWSDEHPKKTYAQDFFEKFPNVQRGSYGTPLVCRKEIYGRACPKIEDCGYTGTCKNCWNEPMEE